MAYGKKNNGDRKNIEERELKVYQKSENKMGETRLRLVSWVIDGKILDPMFEKRAFSVNQDGNVRMGKAKGMTLADIQFVQQNIAAIISDMKSFTTAKHDEEVKTASNKDGWNMEEEEKEAEEMFS